MDGMIYVAGLVTEPGTVLAHMGEQGDGPFWLIGPVVATLWFSLIAGGVWLAARTFRRREGGGTGRAREILAERYAAGDITTDEYLERSEALR